MSTQNTLHGFQDIPNMSSLSISILKDLNSGVEPNLDTRAFVVARALAFEGFSGVKQQRLQLPNNRKSD